MRCESPCSRNKHYVRATSDCKQRHRTGRFTGPRHTMQSQGARWRELANIGKIDARMMRSPTVWRANAGPAVTHLMIVHAWVIDDGRKSKNFRRETPHRGQDRIGRHDPIVLSSYERNPRVDQSLLGVKHVKRGSLPGLGFFAHAVEGNFGCRYLGLGRRHLGLAGDQLSPSRYRVGTSLIAGLLKSQPLLRERFLGLAN